MSRHPYSHSFYAHLTRLLQINQCSSASQALPHIRSIKRSATKLDSTAIKSYKRRKYIRGLRAIPIILLMPSPRSTRVCSAFRLQRAVSRPFVVFFKLLCPEGARVPNLYFGDATNEQQQQPTDNGRALAAISRKRAAALTSVCRAQPISYSECATATSQPRSKSSYLIRRRRRMYGNDDDEKVHTLHSIPICDGCSAQECYFCAAI